jgi:biotin carboxyl carrier protein
MVVRKIGDHLFEIMVDDQKYLAFGISANKQQYVQVNGETYAFAANDLMDEAKNKDGSGGAKTIYAPMPGKVIKVLIAPGQAVKVDDRLMIIESMKMETEVIAEIEGTVERCPFREGDQFSQGDVLVALK